MQCGGAFGEEKAEATSALPNEGEVVGLLDTLGNLKRTSYCGALRAADADKDVVLMGWVHRRRDLGQLIFIDLRDRAGIAQIVFNQEQHPEAHAKAEELRSEFVVAVEGRVVRRGKANPEIATGEVEVVATRLHILNNSKTPPFQIEEEVTASEETRLRYRYLDMRRPKLHANIELRHRIVFEMRKTLDALGFFEIETPLLTRSSPEGARDCLVPSRIHHGQFYALPQSPQIFKQILMISGMDRYFQICKCIRDEDFRADRQLEFTQLDLEMSFPTQDAIFDVIERVMERVCAVAGVTVTRPFRHLDYKDVLRRYGSDKPDLRFGMELHNVTQFFEAARETFKFEGNVQAVVGAGRGRMVAQAARRVGGSREGFGRERRLYGEGDAGGDFVAAGKNARRGRAEEIVRGGRGESRRFGGGRCRERSDSAFGHFADGGWARAAVPRQQTEPDRSQ